MASIKVSKIDAARRQLDMAIRLWFSDSDPIVVHALACSAFQIIQDINHKKGDKSITLLEITRSVVKREHVKVAMEAIREPMNFFKHADRDPHGILEFETEISVTFIALSIFGLDGLGEQLTDVQTTFQYWTRLHKPHWFNQGHELLNKLGSEHLTILKNGTKAEFFDTFLTALAKKKGFNNG